MTVEAGPDAIWTYVACPVVVVDQAGVVRTLNPSAQSLLPGAAAGSRLKDLVPPWLLRAHHSFTQTPSASDGAQTPVLSGTLAGREFEARPALLPGGEVAWSLVEGTARLLREAQQALARERQRTAFLVEASSVLMASLRAGLLRLRRLVRVAAHPQRDLLRRDPTSPRPPTFLPGPRSGHHRNAAVPDESASRRHRKRSWRPGRRRDRSALTAERPAVRTRLAGKIPRRNPRALRSMEW
jgi:hypothetical protein